MKAELISRGHTVVPDAKVFEIWYDGQMIGTIYGDDGPGIRVISKYPLGVREQPGSLGAINIVHVKIG